MSSVEDRLRGVNQLGQERSRNIIRSQQVRDPEHHLSQDASRIPEVRSQIGGDCGLSLVEWRDGRRALQDAFPTPLADRFAQRRCVTGVDHL